jgi:hypothetical protein
MVFSSPYPKDGLSSFVVFSHFNLLLQTSRPVEIKLGRNVHWMILEKVLFFYQKSTNRVGIKPFSLWVQGRYKTFLSVGTG